MPKGITQLGERPGRKPGLGLKKKYKAAPGKAVKKLLSGSGCPKA